MHAVRINAGQLPQNPETLLETPLEQIEVCKCLEREVPVRTGLSEGPEDPLRIEEASRSLMLPRLRKSRLKVNR